MKLTSILSIASVVVVPIVATPCTTSQYDALDKCAKVVAANVYDFVGNIRNPASLATFCAGTWPECTDLKALASSADGNCDFVLGHSLIITASAALKCPATPPAGSKNIFFCTVNNLILSEYYSQLYVDKLRNNDNERFTYNSATHTISVASNNQCLEAVPGATPTLHTAACDNNKATQKWTLNNNRAINNGFDACLKTNPDQPGSQVTVGACDYSSSLNSGQFFADCTTIVPNYVLITSSRGKRMSEYYTGLYFDTPSNNTNELFIWDNVRGMIKSKSSGQCLDSFLDSNGKYQVHTYPCDANNANQKWTVNNVGGVGTIEHKTHKGQCLNGDPTFADHHVQMKECSADYPNQLWGVSNFNPSVNGIGGPSLDIQI